VRFTGVLFLFLLMWYGSCAQFTAREYFKFGKTRFDEGKYYETIEFLDQAINADSLYENAYFLRGLSFFSLNKYSLSIRDFTFLIDHHKILDVTLSDYFFHRATAYFENKEFFPAKEDFDNALKLNPFNPDIYYERSRLKFYTLNNKLEAITDLDRAIKINPVDARYYRRRADYEASESMSNFYALDPLKSAINDMNNAILLDSANYEYYSFRGELNKRAGNPLQAVNDYSKMIGLEPERFNAYTERAVIEMQFDDYKQAIVDFTSAINKHPEDEKNYRYRALCRYNSLDYIGAYSDYSIAVILLNEKLKNVSDKQTIQRILADTYIKRGVSATSMGNNLNACNDFKTAFELGSVKGLNYYRKYCGY
jgi:tetratricopeptide (TPR) repeat protein